MGADVLLEVVDHLFLMVKVLDGEKDGHGEGEKTDQPKDDLKAKAFIKLGQFDKAIEEFRKAAQSDPKHVNSRYNIGLVLLHDKQDIKSAIIVCHSVWQFVSEVWQFKKKTTKNPY